MFENNSSNEKLPVRSASLKKIHLESYRFILITLEEAVTEGLSRNNTFLFYWVHFDLLGSVSVLEGWKMNFICFRFSHIWVRMFCYNSNSQVLNRRNWSYAVLISKLCSECSLGSSSRSKEEVDPIRMLSRGILISRSVQFSYFDCQVNKFISWLIAGVMFLEGDGRKQNHTWPQSFQILPAPSSQAIDQPPEPLSSSRWPTKHTDFTYTKHTILPSCPNKPGPPTTSILTGLDTQNWTATPPPWNSSCMGPVLYH